MQRERHETEILKSLQSGLFHKNILYEQKLEVRNPRPKMINWLFHFGNKEWASTASLSYARDTHRDHLS